jgi:hypothetical protein
MRRPINATRLLGFFACTLLVCVVALWYAAGIRRKRDSQQWRNNERQAAAHIAAIRPEWEAFKRTNAGLEAIQLRPTYHEDGTLEVFGAVTSQVQVAQVLQFLRDTHPPKPLYSASLRVDQAWYQDSLFAATNGRQPTISETNSAQAAAGSGR